MTKVMGEVKVWGTQVCLGNNEYPVWAKIKNEEVVRDTPEKITCGQIQGGQVERLGLYSVDIQCLGRGMT